LNPSFKFTEEGKKLKEELETQGKEEDYSSSSNEEYDSESSYGEEVPQEPLQKKPKVDLVDLFKLKEGVEHVKTIKKLSSDDIPIMRKLVNKYGDNISKMFRDIKLNYMQWSKGELRKKYDAYMQHNDSKK
jgi:hypothetical protein